jgi:hypothetical protein
VRRSHQRQTIAQASGTEFNLNQAVNQPVLQGLKTANGLVKLRARAEVVPRQRQRPFGNPNQLSGLNNAGHLIGTAQSGLCRRPQRQHLRESQFDLREAHFAQQAAVDGLLRAQLHPGLSGWNPNQRWLRIQLATDDPTICARTRSNKPFLPF